MVPTLRCRPDDCPPYPPAGRRWRGRSCPIPPAPVTAVLGRPGRSRGQALVELALVVPVLLFIVLAIAETALLGSAKLRQDAATIEAARWSAGNPGEDLPVAFGLDACDVSAVVDPDAGLVTIGATCAYSPVALRGLWDGLDVSSEAVALIPGEVATETASPEPSEVAP